MSFSEIIPGLFVGDEEAAKLVFIPGGPPVSRVINCANELFNWEEWSGPFTNGQPSDVYIKIPLEDDGSPKDLQVFEDGFKAVVAFLGDVSIEDKPVLIHCAMGISRSASMAAAVMCHLNPNLTVDTAVSMIMSKRPVAFDGGTCQLYRPVLNKFFAKND